MLILIPTFMSFMPRQTNKRSHLGAYLKRQAAVHPSNGIDVVHQDGLSPKAQRFLAVLAVLIFLFMLEPIPLEITAILIGVFLVVMQIVDVKTAWAPYMHPVVVFHHVLPNFCHCAGQGGNHQATGAFHRGQSRH
jgi:hypothetical protein